MACILLITSALVLVATTYRSGVKVLLVSGSRYLERWALSQWTASNAYTICKAPPISKLPINLAELLSMVDHFCFRIHLLSGLVHILPLP